jgi:hypothetical protein
MELSKLVNSGLDYLHDRYESISANRELLVNRARASISLGVVLASLHIGCSLNYFANNPDEPDDTVAESVRTTNTLDLTRYGIPEQVEIHGEIEYGELGEKGVIIIFGEDHGSLEGQLSVVKSVHHLIEAGITDHILIEDVVKDCSLSDSSYNLDGPIRDSLADLEKWRVSWLDDSTSEVTDQRDELDDKIKEYIMEFGVTLVLEIMYRDRLNMQGIEDFDLREKALIPYQEGYRINEQVDVLTKMPEEYEGSMYGDVPTTISRLRETMSDLAEKLRKANGARNEHYAGQTSEYMAEIGSLVSVVNLGDYHLGATADFLQKMGHPVIRVTPHGMDVENADMVARYEADVVGE